MTALHFFCNFPAISRKFSQLDLTLPDRNPPPPPAVSGAAPESTFLVVALLPCPVLYPTDMDACAVSVLMHLL